MKYKIGDKVRTVSKFETEYINGLPNGFYKLCGIICEPVPRTPKIFRVHITGTTMVLTFRRSELECNKKQIRIEKLKQLGV